MWRLRYKLSLRDLAELFLDRGFVFTHEAVRDWEGRPAPGLTDCLRVKRRGKGGAKWHVDEIDVRVNDRWCSLSRAIDREGNPVDARLSERRDLDAARRSFVQALGIAGRAPEQVTTDGHDAYARAIREAVGSTVMHRTGRYKNNRIEQDRRGSKQRYYPMRGFGTFDSAARYPAFEEQRHYFRAVVRSGEAVARANRRSLFQDRWAAIMARSPPDRQQPAVVPVLTQPVTGACGRGSGGVGGGPRSSHLRFGIGDGGRWEPNAIGDINRQQNILSRALLPSDPPQESPDPEAPDVICGLGGGDQRRPH